MQRKKFMIMSIILTIIVLLIGIWVCVPKKSSNDKNKNTSKESENAVNYSNTQNKETNSSNKENSQDNKDNKGPSGYKLVKIKDIEEKEYPNVFEYSHNGYSTSEYSTNFEYNGSHPDRITINGYTFSYNDLENNIYDVIEELSKVCKVTKMWLPENNVFTEDGKVIYAEIPQNGILKAKVIEDTIEESFKSKNTWNETMYIEMNAGGVDDGVTIKFYRDSKNGERLKYQFKIRQGKEDNTNAIVSFDEYKLDVDTSKSKIGAIYFPFMTWK